MKNPSTYLLARLKDFLDTYKPRKYDWGYNPDSKEIFCNVYESKSHYNPDYTVYINESFYSFILYYGSRFKDFNLTLEDLLKDIEIYKTRYKLF